MARLEDPAKRALVDWVLSSGPADGPFQLCPWIYVADPVKFHESVVGDVKDGPSGPRARTGALIEELGFYKKVRGG